MTVMPGVPYFYNGTQFVAPGRASLPVIAGPSRPSGADFTTYESISSSAEFGPRVDSVGASKQVTLASGTFEWSDFDYPNTTTPDYGAMLLNAAGLHGSGPAYTFLRMTPGTSTRASRVPVHNEPTSNGQTNPQILMRVGWEQVSTVRHLSGFTLEGTDQGHFYRGLMLYEWPAGSDIKRCRIRGIPGIASREPGETFSCEVYKPHGTSGSPILLEDVEVDGRRNGTGTALAASGFAVNNGTYTSFVRTNCHDMAYAHGYALYTTSNLSFTQAKASNCTLNGFNFENVSGAVIMDRIEAASCGSHHIGIFTNTGSAAYTITDPIVEGAPISASNKLRMRVTGYSGGARTQDLTAIKVFVAGVDHTSDYVTMQLT